MVDTKQNCATKDKVPALLAFWGSLIHTLPPVKVGGLDWSVTIVTVFLLTAARFAAEYVLIAVFGWPADSELTQEGCCSITAFIHSFTLVPGLWQCFRSHPYRPSEKITEAPVWWQDAASALTQFCTGYMIFDATVNILWPRRETGLTTTDSLFLGHHFATAFVMVSARVVGAGQQSVLMCMFLGEFTNPFMSSYHISKKAMRLACCNGPWMEGCFRVLEIVFAGVYVVVRGPVAPLVFTPMTWDLWTSGRKHIPIWLLGLWTFMIYGVLIGSWPWTVECWGLLTKRATEMGFLEAAVRDGEL